MASSPPPDHDTRAFDRPVPSMTSCDGPAGVNLTSLGSGCTTEARGHGMREARMGLAHEPHFVFRDNRDRGGGILRSRRGPVMTS